MKKFLFKNKRGFSLTEMLITVTIIGVVSVLAIPTLVSRIDEKVTVYKYLRTYEEINDAYKMALMKKGPVNNWIRTARNQNERHYAFYSTIKEYLKNTKTCEQAGQYCLGNVVLKSLDGTNYANYDDVPDHIEPRLVLSNGAVLWFYSSNTALVHGNIKIDLNGSKGPNAWGRDTFALAIKTADNTLTAEPIGWKDLCSINKHDGLNGYGCGWWIFKHHNMNYLHCDVDDAHPDCH